MFQEHNGIIGLIRRGQTCLWFAGFTLLAVELQAQSNLPVRISTPSAASVASQPDFFQRWFLVAIAGLILGRAVWRYFHEVADDDDFANRLVTLAPRHHWAFAAYLGLLLATVTCELLQIGNMLGLLALALSLRRYFCEGDFASHPKAKKVHWLLRCLLIGWGWVLGPGSYLANPHVWARPQVAGWVGLALTAIIFSQFYNSEELAQHRKELYFLSGALEPVARLARLSVTCSGRITTGRAVLGIP